MYLEIYVCMSKKLGDVIKIMVVYNDLAYVISDFISWSFMRLNPVQLKIILNQSIYGFQILALSRYD